MFSRKITISIFSKNTQNCFAYNSATKYRSEAVLYLKRTAGHPLSSPIKTINVAFLQAEKHPTLGVWCTPLKYFSEFYKLFLGFYKSQFSGTTFVLVEKCLLLVYRLFKNSKNLTFIRVRRHKTLNDAIYIFLRPFLIRVGC